MDAVARHAGEEGAPQSAHTLNMLRAPRRFGWLIWPWMGTVPKPKFRSVSAILRVLSQVRAKIMTVEPASSVSAYAR